MIAIIIPAYNEEKNIGRVVRGLFEQGFNQTDDKEFKQINDDGFRLIVVDDGSSDKTGEIARREGAKVLRHQINRGQGAALETGNEYARQSRAEIAVHFDGDGQHNPADIIPAIATMRKKQVDAVLGSRFLDARSRIPWFKRYVLLPVSRWINFVFTGVKLSDAHNGFRIMGERALNLISITQDGMAHNSEIVRSIKKYGLRFAEFPVEVRYKEFGQGIGGGVKIVWDLILGKFY